MADEIQATSTLRVGNGSLKYNSPNRSFKADMAGTHRAGGATTIGLTAEALPMGDVATPGVGEFTNTHATATIRLGVYIGSTFYGVVSLLAGETWQCRIDSTCTLYAISDASGGAVLDWNIFEA